MLKMENYIGKRKHISQMTENEVEGLFERLKSVERDGLKWRITTHALDRIREKNIEANYQDLESLIHNASLVEYKIDKNKFDGQPEERVVIVSKFAVNKRYKLHAVYSLTKRRIITAWVNRLNDNHDTLNWNLYSSDTPVFNI